MVKKGCEKNQSKRENKMECNVKAAHVGNQQNVFGSQQYFPHISSGAIVYTPQNMPLGHSKYPSNEQFYQRSGPVLSSQSIPGTVPNMQHVQSQQYATQNYYANACQTVFQQVSNPAGILKEASSNQKCNRSTNDMFLEYMNQKNCYMPAYYQHGTSTLPQSINGQFSFQPAAAYQKVQGHAPFPNAGEVSGKNSNMQVPPPYSHLGSQMSYDVQSEWPPNLSSDLSTQTFNHDSVHPQHGESLPKQMQSRTPEQDQRHVQLPEAVLKLLQPKQSYKQADKSVQNQPNLYSNAPNPYYDWHQQPQKTATENGCNNDVLSPCEPHNANSDTSISPKDTGSNVSSQACTDLIQRVLRYGHEYTSAPANAHNHMDAVPALGNYSVYGSSGFPNSMVHSLNHTEKSDVSREAMVQLPRKVLGAKDDYVNALWHYTHAATIHQNPEALPSYKTACQQNQPMHRYSPREENYVNPTSMGNTGLCMLANGQQIVKSSPTSTVLSSHCAQDQNEPAPSTPFSNYLRNAYQTSEGMKKSCESVEKPKSPSDFRNSVKSEQRHKECALASGQSAGAIKTQTNIQSGHSNLCTVPDRNGNPMEKESLSYSARDQTCNPRQNETSGRDTNLPSPNSKSTASESVTSTIVSQLETGQVRSLPSDIIVKQEPSDTIQDSSNFGPCNKMVSSIDGSDEQQLSRDVDPKPTLPPQGLCEQNDEALNKSQKAVFLNEKTNTASSMDVGNRCSDRAVTVRKPELFGINMRKTAEPQIAVVNPLTPSKSESPSKDQENVPPRNGMYPAPQEALRGPLSQQRKRKLAVVSTNGNIDHISSVNTMLDILDSDASVNCPGSQKIIQMACALNSKLSVSQGKAKRSVPALNSTKPLLQLKSNEFTPPPASPLCQEKPELQFGDDPLLLVNGACEEQLQISSVCTLVEGSTFYDSQMAKIFDADPLEQSKETNIESEGLVVLQRNLTMDVKNKTCEAEVLEPSPKRQHLDQNCTGENQSSPVGKSNGSNQKVLVSSSEPEQTVLDTLHKETFVELSRANEGDLSFNPITSQTEKDSCRNEGQLEEQMPNMTDSIQDEMPDGYEASSEPYLNSQLSELLRMFPFGIDTMETGAFSEESEVSEKDQDGSSLSQLRKPQPDQENTVSSQVVGQAEKTQPTKQAEVVKELQFNNDCSSPSPDIDPEDGDTMEKEKGKPKSKDLELVPGLKSDRAVHSMQCGKLCSLEQPSIALLNSQHPSFLFPANARQPPCDSYRKSATMTNVPSANSKQISFKERVGMDTMQPVSNFLLSVYSGEQKGFYLNNMAANSRTIPFNHNATYQKPVNHITNEHSYLHVNSSSQMNANSEKIEDPATFQLTHQGKLLQNGLPETSVGWQKKDWVNSAKNVKYLHGEQNLYHSTDARKTGTCESKGEQNVLRLQHVTAPTAGGAQIAYGYQDSTLKEHLRNTQAYHKVDHKSRSPKKHKEPKEKKKKNRLIVKTDFLKPKANKNKVCQKTAKEQLSDEKIKVSENGCIKCVFSSDKCDVHSTKLGEDVQVALSDNSSCLVTDRGLIGEKQGLGEGAREERSDIQTLVRDAVSAADHLHNLAVQEFFQRLKAEQNPGGKKTQKARENHKAKQPCEEPKDPHTLVHDAVSAADHLHNLSVQEFFQRRKAEQNTGVKKTQKARENLKAKQPVQYRKPSITFENLEEGGKRKTEASLGGNVSEHPKKAPQKPMESIGEHFLTRIAFTGYKNGVIQLVNFNYLNSAKNHLPLKASKPIVTKKPETPAEELKVLEFKLCPEELLGRHTAEDEPEGARPPVSQDDPLSEEIQKKADSSSSNIPLKKRKVDMALLQGNINVPKQTLNRGIFSTEQKSCPQTPNSKVLFSAFKKLHLETQSRKVA
ncbi:uncharacterized protein LOC144810523 [Lissotriton helveticus]